MAITSIYAGAQTPDVAFMEYGGISYRCFVWAAAPQAVGDTQDLPQRIEAALFAEGEDGQMVLIDKRIVAVASGDFVDCPRILAVTNDGLFVVHWIDGTQPADIIASAALHRSMLSLADIAGGWDYQGSVSIHTTCQYDHASVDSGFVVARRSAADAIATTRYQAPFAWVDTVWSDPRSGLTITNTVLACHANGEDDVVFVSYEETLRLRTYRLSASGGTGFATDETFADVDTGDMRFTAVSHARISDGQYLVAAEAIPQDVFGGGGSVLTHLRLVCWRLILSADASNLYQPHWLKNISLESRLWTWASGVTGQVEAYAAWGYKTIYDGGEWDQTIGGVLRFDVAAIPNYEEEAGVIRPIPLSLVASGSYDGRPHGSSPVSGSLISIGKRLNHLSHVTSPPQYTLGPDLKSVLFACTRWGRLVASQDGDTSELQPVEAGVAFTRFFHEPAWTVRRDEKEPQQPSSPAWRGVAPSHALPVETPAGLVWTGGITTTYDGQQAVEMGFLYNIEIDAEASSEVTITEAGTYYYTVTPVWVDARGNAHRGPPCRPVAVELDGTNGTQLDIRCINLTLKDDRERYPTAQRIYFEVWRTNIVGSDLETKSGNYLLRSIYGGDETDGRLEDLPASDHREFTVRVFDGRDSDVVQYNELCPYQLNTTTLQWTPLPPIPHQPLSVAAMWKNRLFGVDPEQGMLRWSEEILPRGVDLVKPEFLDTNTMRLDGRSEVTALQPMDDVLLIFTRDGIYGLTGDPGAGGSGASFNLQHIAKDIGCIEPRSVVHYSEGVLFQSAKGIHRVTRGGGIDYPGAPIEDLVRAAGNVRSAVHLENRHQIRYTLQATPGTGPLEIRPRIATFDYRVGLWSTRNLPALAQSSTASRLNEMQHACAWRGRQGETLHVVLAQGGLAIERTDDDTVYADVGASGTVSIPLDVTTEWIHVGGIAGLNRVKEIGIQTERTHPGPLTIELWFDVVGTWNSDRTRDQAYTYDGVTNFAPAYIAIRPRYQKISGFKMRIYEPTSTPQTENVRLVSMTILWEPKPGMRKVARRALT